MSLTRRELAGLLPIAAALGAAAAPPEPGETAADFLALAAAEFAWREAQFGDDDSAPRKIRDFLPDVGAEAQAARLARWRATKARLARFDPAGFAPADQVNFQVYQAQIDALEAAWAFGEWQAPFNSDSSFWDDMAGTAERTFRTPADYRNYIVQLSQTRRYFSQQIEAMKLGLARGFTPHRATLAGRDLSVLAVAQAPPRATVFWKPFAAMPAAFDPALRADLQAKGEAVIAAEVIPAHETLYAFLHEVYVPGARAGLAAADLPDGAAYYRSKIVEFTTLDLAPAEIHAYGLAEIAAIRARMQAVMAEVKFSGDLAAFLAFLRADPRFYVTTPQALLDRAAWIAKTFDGKAADWFGRLPRSRFAIKPVPDPIAPYYTAGRGGPGVYLVNTYDLPSRPLYALTALTLHESAPGHAFQIPLAEEQRDQPAFRRRSYISAFGEGWALYCERLGEEMGMYPTPYDRFGMLSYQAWRAARLVVDTGIHTKGWSRDEARAYLAANTALSEHEIGTEVDRYISWPGQSLSYYLGQKAILAARAKAEAALGPKFDIRAFHDTVLMLGSVPLPALAARIDRFVAEGGPSPYPEDDA